MRRVQVRLLLGAPNNRSVGEMDYASSLENCRVRNGSVSSNLTASAKYGRLIVLGTTLFRKQQDPKGLEFDSLVFLQVGK